MNAARWHQIKSLYNKALEMEATQRAAFLREACGVDRDLQRDLEELLAEGPQASGFLEKAALGKSRTSLPKQRTRCGHHGSAATWATISSCR